MRDYAYEKRIRWIRDAQHTSVIECYQVVDFVLLGLFLLLLLGILLEW